MPAPVPPLLSVARFGPALATFDEMEIPGITRCEPSRREIASTEETAAGKGRFDFVASKRTWRVETTHLPLAIVQSLEDYLISIGWGWGDWWCWRISTSKGSTVRARISEWQERPLERAPHLWAVSFAVIEQ